MANGYNRVTILGNLGADGELRTTKNDGFVLAMRIATTASWTDKESGTKKEHTEWHRAVMFGKRAEALAPHVTKGKTVLIEGRLRTQEWEKEGQKHYSTEIVAEDLVFAGNPKAKSDDDAPRPAASSSKTNGNVKAMPARR